MSEAISGHQGHSSSLQISQKLHIHINVHDVGITDDEYMLRKQVTYPRSFHEHWKNTKLVPLIGETNLILRELYPHLVTTREFSNTSKLSAYKSVLIPTLHTFMHPR